ncbi:MAG: hypothetical protein COB97_06775 [Paracoccus sp.]|nr:MAG: hypothetical protein COB97_06775 [Paracoccus sp. (in: a-proteobacteria)]
MTGLPKRRPVLSETEGAAVRKGQGLMSFLRWEQAFFRRLNLRAILSLTDPIRSLGAGTK